MKTTTQSTSFWFIALFVIATNTLFSNELTISFSASGLSNSIDSISAINTTTGTRVLLSGSGQLKLSDQFSGLTDLIPSKRIAIQQSFQDASNCLLYYSDKGREVTFQLLAINGTQLLNKQLETTAGLNRFTIQTLPGVYIINILEDGVRHSAKLISQSGICYSIASLAGEVEISRSKIPVNQTTLGYSVGNQLIFRAYSGKHSTIVPARPTNSETINFEFIECKDGSGNYYPVVKIGTQWWMAENLKTTKFRNGTAITLITNTEQWEATSQPAYCEYANNPVYGLRYGYLYNGHAAMDAKNLAPANWKVPTGEDIDFLEANLMELELYKLTGNVEIWQIAKSLASSNGWNTSSISGQIGHLQHLNNTSGFSAIPGGFRTLAGDFSGISDNGNWWTTEVSDDELRYFFLRSTDTDLVGGSESRNYGFSIRCIKE